MKHTNIIRTALCAAAFVAAGAFNTVHAAPQRTAFATEANSLPKGMWEFENKVSWDHSSGANAFEFEHELEFGITDKLQAAVLVSWAHEAISGEPSESAFGAAGVELFYNLLNPVTDPVGLSFSVETVIGDKEFAVEGRTILQKNFGPIALIYNATIEAVWEGSDYGDRVGEFSQNLAVSYDLGGGFYANAELIHQMEWANWDVTELNALYVGPSVGYRKGNFWGAIGGGWQVASDKNDASDFIGSLRIGVTF
jgi:hypothetical protein